MLLCNLPCGMAVPHVLVLSLVDLELPPELRIWRTFARNPAGVFFRMFPTSVPIFTLIHSVLLEISDANSIPNSRFPVLPGGFIFRGQSGETAKNVGL